MHGCSQTTWHPFSLAALSMRANPCTNNMALKPGKAQSEPVSLMSPVQLQVRHSPALEQINQRLQHLVLECVHNQLKVVTSQQISDQCTAHDFCQLVTVQKQYQELVNESANAIRSHIQCLQQLPAASMAHKAADIMTFDSDDNESSCGSALDLEASDDFGSMFRIPETIAMMVRWQIRMLNQQHHSPRASRPSISTSASLRMQHLCPTCTRCQSSICSDKVGFLQQLKGNNTALAAYHLFQTVSDALYCWLCVVGAIHASCCAPAAYQQHSAS